MSFWDNFNKRFGLSYNSEGYDEYDEDGADGYEEDEQPAPRERRRAPAMDFSAAESAAAPAAEPAAAQETSGRFTGKVLSMNGKQSVVLFRPNTFNDASKAADDLRDKKVVIVNMENVDRDMARRVVDFLSGCSYALDGKARKIAQATYLFAPHNMDVMGDLENVQAEAETYV